MEMVNCDKCIHAGVCKNYTTLRILDCPLFTKYAGEAEHCIYFPDAICNYPLEDCKNCPVRES